MAAYSKFSVPAVWKAFKMTCPERTEQAYCDFSHKAIQNKLIQGDQLTACYMMLDATIEFLWKFRTLTHYFLAPGVAEFCISSVKDFSPEYCKRFPNCPVVEAPGGTHFTYYFDGWIPGGFAVHFPTCEKRKSIVAIPQYIQPSYKKEDWDSGSGILDIFYIAAGDGESNVLMHKKSDNTGFPKQATEMGKLLFGLSLYMDAFPDVVVESVCDKVKSIQHYRGNRSIVQSNAIVNEERRHGVSPHWRRGHFRLLLSKKFIRKQGQTVYVRGSFVKGKAFDVLEDSPPLGGKGGL